MEVIKTVKEKAIIVAQKAKDVLAAGKNKMKIIKGSKD